VACAAGFPAAALTLLQAEATDPDTLQTALEGGGPRMNIRNYSPNVSQLSSQLEALLQNRCVYICVVCITFKINIKWWSAYQFRSQVSNKKNTSLDQMMTILRTKKTSTTALRLRS